jgi:hypothetical protein
MKKEIWQRDPQKNAKYFYILSNYNRNIMQQTDPKIMENNNL